MGEATTLPARGEQANGGGNNFANRGLGDPDADSSAWWEAIRSRLTPQLARRLPIGHKRLCGGRHAGPM
jgi:hypothetical protein